MLTRSLRCLNTISTLTSITAQYTLVERINDIAQGSGLSDLIITKPIWKGLVDDKLSTAQMTDMGKQMGVIPADQSLADFMKEKDLTTMGQLRTELKRFFDENYQVIEESKSPMKGKAIKKDFVSMLKLTPMYAGRQQGTSVVLRLAPPDAPSSRTLQPTHVA
jgi:hypothetical protein